ncbi:MAG: hypothetical protein QOC64_778 [Solirubrobacteraceae bacterium]|nr:hypothetical protein [Solirubrobacteraceae bacterium]
MRRLRPSRLLLAGLLLLAVAAPVAMGAVGPQPGQRIDMRVLLLSADGKEATFGAWKAALEREGVPYDAKIADAEAPFTDATFADYAANRARYQAVILATGDLVHRVDNPDGSSSFPSALADSEWTALAKFEQTFGIRQISDSTTPSPAHGLNFATNTGPQDGNTGQLTATGLQLFPYLKGPVPIDNASPTGVDSFGYQATPATLVAPATFDTLVSGPGGSAYLGIYTHADGREEMVSTVDGNQFQIHNNLLRHGMLSWATRGVYLGHQRNYYEMHIDDVLLPDDRWDMTLNKTAVDGPTTASDEVQCGVTGGPPCRPIRMTPADVTRLVAWQNTTGIKLDMVYNGGGSEQAKEDSGTNSDPLTDSLLASKSQFWWINHTFTHPNLDSLSQATLTSEIAQNTQWGLANGLPMDQTELVTGEHSGLHNPSMPAALSSTGIRWIAADNSREPTPYAIGPATTVPRYPSNVYYNVATRAEQLDEYNHVYLPPSLGGKCVNTSTNTCRTAPATWSEYVSSEADIMFRHLMGNDPRPHFAHQSNLVSEVAGEPGVLYDVVDAMLARYRAAFKPELVQLTQKQIGEEIDRQAKWRQDLAAGRVTAYLQDGEVHVTTTATMQVPITGTPAGALYGGERSGWFTVTGSEPVTQPAPGAQPAPPTQQPARPAQPARPGQGSGAAGTTPGGAVRGTQVTSLKLERLRMTKRRFAVSRSARVADKRRGRAPDGTTITWMLNDRGTVSLSVQKLVAGRRVDGRCVAASAKRRGRACTRAVRVGTLKRAAIKGENTVRFSGRVGKRTLRPGRYRMTVRATGSANRSTPAKTLTFTVVKG